MALICFYFLGMCVGAVIGLRYIPHQIRRKNPKVIAEIEELLRLNK